MVFNSAEKGFSDVLMPRTRTRARLRLCGCLGEIMRMGSTDVKFVMMQKHP